jgi:hypothetical protein
MCKNATNKETQPIKDNSKDISSASKDSLCINYIADLKVQNCKMVEFCEKMFDNSTTSDIVSKGLQKKPEINFNKSNLKFFNVSGDTVLFSNYFVESSDRSFYPTEIFIKEDTLRFILGSKGAVVGGRDVLHLLNFKILLDKGVRITAIKWDGDEP